jgi:hypothetical protein
VRHLVILLAILCTPLVSSCRCDEKEAGADCQDLVERILVIQDKRHLRMAQLDPVLAAFEAGDIEKPEMLEQSRSWQAAEADLRGQVSELYDQARARGCL